MIDGKDDWVVRFENFGKVKNKMLFSDFNLDQYNEDGFNTFFIALLSFLYLMKQILLFYTSVNLVKLFPVILGWEYWYGLFCWAAFGDLHNYTFSRCISLPFSEFLQFKIKLKKSGIITFFLLCQYTPNESLFLPSMLVLSVVLLPINSSCLPDFCTLGILAILKLVSAMQGFSQKYWLLLPLSVTCFSPCADAIAYEAKL